MLIQQFFIPGIAHSSYIVAGSRSCAVIDPARDINRYLAAAGKLGVKITHIMETHLHADFVSGHLDLADATGATIYAPRAAACAFPHEGLREGDEIAFEDILFRVIETPGHTPEHICYIAFDRSRGDSPVALFSGDTLFVGDVGRPDLFPGRGTELAGSLYRSLHEKILSLPDECEVYPAHGMGSLCGRMMAAKRTSTIGYERKYNYALLIENEEEFVRTLTSEMPAAPDHFARCSEINRRGPMLLRTLAPPDAMEADTFQERIGDGDAIVLDTRSYLAFSGLHIPGAWHVDLAGNFATQAGWVIPPDRGILLVNEREGDAQEATIQLHRVGFDRIEGHLAGGMFAWALSAFPTRRIPLLSPVETNQLVRAGEALLLDVRSWEERTAGHANGSVHIPWHDLRTRHRELDPERHTIVMCRGGQRASIAASILLMHGFEHVSNLAGGFTAYRRAGFAA